MTLLRFLCVCEIPIIKNCAPKNVQINKSKSLIKKNNCAKDPKMHYVMNPESKDGSTLKWILNTVKTLQLSTFYLMAPSC